MNSEWQSLQPQTQQELKNTMNAMQPPQSIEEIKAGLETTEKGGVRQSIRNCLTVFQRDPLLSGAIAYNILTDRKDIIKPIGFHRESTALNDTDMKYLLLYLEETYGLTNEKKIDNAIGISNTFDIVMAVFDLTQKVVSDSSGIIAGNTRVNDIGLSMLEASLMQMDVGPLFGLFLQSFFIGITMRILSIVIFVIVYGRMIEIYCMVSLAPIPMATWGNHEQSHMGQNYLKCLFALGFQGFLILICVAIYAVLIQSVAISGDAINSIWGIVGYTVLLCFSLFKTSSVTKSVLGAH